MSLLKELQKQGIDIVNYKYAAPNGASERRPLRCSVACANSKTPGAFLDTFTTAPLDSASFKS